MNTPQSFDLADLAENYLRMRRHLGFKLVSFSTALHGFVRFMQEQHEPVITTALAVQWAKDEAPRSELAYTWGRRLMVVRIFARHANALDPRHQIPPADILPAPTRRSLPYIYDDVEVDALMRAASALLPPFRGKTMSTFIGLLSVTGMRTGEVHRLNLEDVDLDHGVIHVVDSKFNKSREIPLHPSTVKALANYRQERDRYLGGQGETTAFFVNVRKVRFKEQSPNQCFPGLLAIAGITAPGRPLPHLHDFRHTFATRTLTEWYRNGEDVEAMMPVLSTYLGHVDPKSTFWYLTGTLELMGLAAERLSASLGFQEEQQ
ncbi:tyrosine-type recombinase/integrase [Glutamicibacter soli]|uniref:Tyrosine-type recombinase/integrase n=1 Tax=Glutamicibacter soli TaxID=453836 RepID=A0A6L9G817_9MICC|nr:tyrosine-type recombinase/integrase [Glutamicibacter soli]NAZ17931.1 tyrosine-type recombinase/integrase [Glutamicibacter soli]